MTLPRGCSGRFGVNAARWSHRAARRYSPQVFFLFLSVELFPSVVHYRTTFSVHRGDQYKKDILDFFMRGYMLYFSENHFKQTWVFLGDNLSTTIKELHDCSNVKHVCLKLPEEVVLFF